METKINNTEMNKFFNPTSNYVPNNVYGYARVSSADQNLDRQIEAFKELGIPEENIFTDKQSGKDFNRPGYQALLEKATKGDLIYFKSLDRMGRDYQEIQDQWRRITKELGIDIRIIDMSLLDTTANTDLFGSLITDIVLQILSFQSDQERRAIKQRQAEGIAIAKEKGVKFGRPKKPLPHNFNELVERYLAGESFSKLSKECDMSQSTLRSRIIECINGGKERYDE